MTSLSPLSLGRRLRCALACLAGALILALPRPAPALVADETLLLHRATDFQIHFGVPQSWTMLETEGERYERQVFHWNDPASATNLYYILVPIGDENGLIAFPANTDTIRRELLQSQATMAELIRAQGETVIEMPDLYTGTHVISTSGDKRMHRGSYLVPTCDRKAVRLDIVMISDERDAALAAQQFLNLALTIRGCHWF